MKTLKNLLPVFFLIATAFTSSLAQASIALPQGFNSVPPPPLQTTNDVTNLLCGSLTWVFYILLVFAVIMALVAAYKYVTSGGDPEKVSSASKTLLYVAIAVAVALIAKGVPYIVSSFLNGGGTANFSICSSV
jgi:hypothetical protein